MHSGFSAAPAASKHTAVSPAVKNAETLFETKNVAEIREIEARTRRDIDHKNLQLRQLVGDSYRDLIGGADKIVAIAQNCNSILQNVLNMQESIANLAVRVSKPAESAIDRKDSVRKHEELLGKTGVTCLMAVKHDLTEGAAARKPLVTASGSVSM
eukprot:jgi/Chrzof1/13034/Cz07g17130.t1